MLYHTLSQPLQLALMLAAGMLMYASSLAFAGLRRLMGAGPALSLVCDALMGMVWAAIFCGTLTCASGGSLRAFHIVSAAAGAALMRAAVALPAAALKSACRVLTRALRRAGDTQLIRALLR